MRAKGEELSGLFALGFGLVSCAPAPSSPPLARTEAEIPAPAEPVKTETVTATPTQPEAPDAGGAEATTTEERANTCVARHPPLSQPVCENARLGALLADYDQTDQQFEGVVRCQPMAVEDLESVPPTKGRFGTPDSGPAFFGDQDINGDGKPDLILGYSSVDYWAWLLFVREKKCLRFVEAVTGYQVELLPSKHHGVRDVRVLTYPLQGQIEKRHFDGNAYVP